MKIKKGDKVKVIAGDDKGVVAEVVAALPRSNRVIVEGVNIQTKHAKARQNQPAEIRKVEGPIHVSNVMYYDTKAKQPVRIGYKVENGHKKRISKKTGQVID